MNIYELLEKRRTVRRFKAIDVEESLILKFIDKARLSPSAANLQSLKYAVVTDEKTRREMYPHIKYAGYTPEWKSTFEITPTAFIAVINDRTIRPNEKSEVDAGISLMTLTLLAEEEGLGSCIIGSVNRGKVKELLGLDDSLDILYLIGIGYPDQENTLVESPERVKYTLDGESFKVPKRTLDEIVIKR